MRAGVIGYGNAGKRHAAAYEAAGLEVDVYNPGMPKPRTQLNKIYNDCDVVSICSPDNTHYQYMCSLLERQKHILCEKPVALSASELSVIQTYLRAEITLECHLPLRYHDSFAEVVRRAKKGMFGEIISIDMVYDWGRPEKLKAWRGHIRDWNLIVGGGIHLIDLAMQLARGTFTQRGVYNVVGTSRLERFDTRSVFEIGDTLCTLATTMHAYIPHRHVLRIVGSRDACEIVNTDEVDHARGVGMFLNKVKHRDPGNIREAMAANHVCINLADAIR